MWWTFRVEVKVIFNHYQPIVRPGILWKRRSNQYNTFCQNFQKLHEIETFTVQFSWVNLLNESTKFHHMKERDNWNFHSWGRFLLCSKLQWELSFIGWDCVLMESCVSFCARLVVTSYRAYCLFHLEISRK